jgi:hypothetical protein
MLPSTARIVLVALTTDRGQLRLLLSEGTHALPNVQHNDAHDPDEVARQLAEGLTGTVRHVARHTFLTESETGETGLLLVYRQLLSLEDLQRSALASSARLEYCSLLFGSKLSSADHAAIQRVVEDIRGDLQQVMHSRLNKRGLVHLLEFLPEIFDHKELVAVYHALSGEKPPSALMLARMMLDRYAVGSGEKAREVQGRDLIREHDQPEPELLGEKWEKNKELYRTGGPKAKRLYKKH